MKTQVHRGYEEYKENEVVQRLAGFLVFLVLLAC
jgi:hypothetical protein